MALPERLVGTSALWVYLAPRDLHWCFAPCDLTVVSLATDEHVSRHRVTRAASLPLNRWSCLTFRRGLPSAGEGASPRRGTRRSPRVSEKRRRSGGGGGASGGSDYDVDDVDDDDDKSGLMRIIMVGAFGVDDFHWTIDATAGVGVERGAPLGHFRAGSSVLLLPWPTGKRRKKKTKEEETDDEIEIGAATVPCLARTGVVSVS